MQDPVSGECLKLITIISDKVQDAARGDDNAKSAICKDISREGELSINGAAAKDKALIPNDVCNK